MKSTSNKRDKKKNMNNKGISWKYNDTSIEEKSKKWREWRISVIACAKVEKNYSHWDFLPSQSKGKSSFLRRSSDIRLFDMMIYIHNSVSCQFPWRLYAHVWSCFSDKSWHKFPKQIYLFIYSYGSCFHNSFSRGEREVWERNSFASFVRIHRHNMPFCHL